MAVMASSSKQQGQYQKTISEADAQHQNGHHQNEEGSVKRKRIQNHDEQLGITPRRRTASEREGQEEKDSIRNKKTASEAEQHQNGHHQNEEDSVKR
eukprot:CAMPEP_0172155644 /NCGR_PEP_ID=MMETSP1050-20130122/2746_1 /TAXON_ID=233186 /ORGANISM="Cryptomonas curvata, Strain CCAP979/52" /LENGTH=96 /DNA_ID=CAMNT_0012824577 /DNA_START=534 /DNA_END=824 /DNA_ORIENTATION=+